MKPAGGKPRRNHTSITISDRCKEVLVELQSCRGGASLGAIIEEAVMRLAIQEQELRAKLCGAKDSGEPSSAHYPGTMCTLSSLLGAASQTPGKCKSKRKG